MFILKLKNLANEQAQDSPKHTNHSFCLHQFWICLPTPSAQPIQPVPSVNGRDFNSQPERAPPLAVPYPVQESLRICREPLLHCSEKQRERITGQNLAHHSELTDSTLKTPAKHSQ